MKLVWINLKIQFKNLILYFKINKRANVRGNSAGHLYELLKKINNNNTYYAHF